MRILISSGPLYGHVNTLLPLALAAQRAGHRVIFATGADLVPHVERYGLEAWAVAPTHAQAGGSRQDSWLRYFAASAERRAAELVPRAAAWRPDLVIHEETELGGAVVAAVTGARHVVHGLGLMPPARIWESFVPAIEQLGQQWDVPDIGEDLRAATYLHICPPALQPPGDPVWKHVLPLRPTAGIASAGERLPDTFEALPHGQTVHLTLGTVFNGANDVLATAIAGLRELPVNLLVTVGPDVDPARYGPQPGHVLIARYLPHTLLLPRCHLVVSHGGSGIMFGALSHGLPQLIIPQGADQFMNADACRQSGAGLVLAPDDVRVNAVADAANRLLTEAAFTVAAQGVRSQIMAMPDARRVLDELMAKQAA
ncbi:MAG: glycosyltransferase [Burkholderiaceae bacterium]